ncbi:MAG: urease subunit gamma [Actinomycetota bacterium]|nr:urease subunit gamma [Actinomycetota bacterium]
MDLTPSERDRLLLFTVAELARSRRRRGVLLNIPETIAIVADEAAETARAGGRLADAIAAGAAAVRTDEVLPGVSAAIPSVEVEAVFDDGTRLIVIPYPLGRPTEPPHEEDVVVARPDSVSITATNTADVPISVTSHFHFFEANPRLRFDRRAAYGMHLQLPAGAAQRFDPGVPVEIRLVPIGGDRVAIGFAGLVDGPLDDPGAREQALSRARAGGYLNSEDPSHVS